METLLFIIFAVVVVALIALIGKGLEMLMFGKEKGSKRGANVEQTGGGLVENPGRNSMHASGPVDGGSGGSTGV